MKEIKKFLVRHIGIPSEIKSQRLIKAYGELYLEVFENAKSQRKLDELSKVIFNLGKKNGERFKKEFGLGETACDAAFTLIVGHRVMGIKSVLAECDDRRAVVRVRDCPWKDMFPPDACDVLGNIEKGACKALNEDLSYKITKKLTDKNDICEFVIEMVK